MCVRVRVCSSVCFNVPSLTLRIQGLRGQGAECFQVILLEEGGFIHPMVLREAIVPLVMMVGTVLLFISSKPKGSTTQHCALMETIRESGQFRIHEVETVCADCRQNGVLMNCMHGAMPPWKAQGLQMKRAMILMQGDKRTFAREVLNEELAGLATYYFNRDAIAKLRYHRDKWAHPGGFSTDVVFIGIDPALGNLRSRYAIVSVAFVRDSPMAPQRLVVRAPPPPTLTPRTRTSNIANLERSVTSSRSLVTDH